MNFSDLPVESFFGILAELDTQSLCTCRQVRRCRRTSPESLSCPR